MDAGSAAGNAENGAQRTVLAANIAQELQINKEQIGVLRNTDSERNVARLRARMMAKEFLQCYEMDYLDVFPPVAQYSSLRTLFLLVAQRTMNMPALAFR